jgi:phosphoglycerate dehydrogenase-like enzyme
MSGANSFKFVLLPPQSDTTRDWAKRLAEKVPEARVIVAENADTAKREIVDAEAAFGWLGSDLLLKATKLRWLQAPQAAPPAGYYYPELIAHSVVVTNFREIFNDHIGAHILAFVLAFARGLHIFIPQQFRREWKKSPAESGDVVHLPEATALIVGVGGMSTPQQRCIVWPEQKYIIDAGKKAPGPGCLSSDIRLGWDYPPVCPSWHGLSGAYSD